MQDVYKLCFDMTRAPASLTRRTQFDEFLYASIGEESNGMPLSVLSALARLDVDPWAEASRLARMPREAATLFLTRLIAALPGGSSACADPGVHAKRLSALLPRPIAAVAGTRAAVAGTRGYRYWLIQYAVYYAIITAIFFGAQWLMERSRQSRDAPAPAVTGSQPLYTH